MKTGIHLTLLIILCFNFILTTQLLSENYQIKADEEESIDTVSNKLVNWFKAEVIANKVWRIEDRGGVNIYLVEGNEKALLIDDGYGVTDLLGYLKTITKLPIVVVNTHGHPDHAGGNFQFKEVYAHPKDFQIISYFTGKGYHKGTVERAVKNSPDFSSFIMKDTLNYSLPKLLPVEFGYVFDLGGRKVEVIDVPGHTKGSICLLDEENKLLFASDNNNLLVWLFLEGCLPLESYLQTLQYLKNYSGKFNTILPGHGQPIDKDFIEEQIECVQNILNGTCKGEPYKSFAGEAKVCYFKRASVAFNPDNLFVKH